MSTLTLVRHAQASFHAEHYDQLSPLGERQARVLGSDWVKRERTFDEVYVGPRTRQRHTAELVAEAYRQAGLPFPDLIELPDLDEYDLHGLLQRLAPALARCDAEFSRLFAGQRQGASSRERERNFQTMFERLMHHWQTVESASDVVESWPAFRTRVARGLASIVARPDAGRRVAAFTSGGFIGTAVQQVLAAPDHAALEINWRVRNGALTELVFSGQRITLDVFNSVAHFAAAELVTYR